MADTTGAQGQRVKTRANDAERLKQYVNAGYTTKPGDSYLYTPGGTRSNVKVDGTLGNVGNTFNTIGDNRRQIANQTNYNPQAYKEAVAEQNNPVTSQPGTGENVPVGAQRVPTTTTRPDLTYPGNRPIQAQTSQQGQVTTGGSYRAGAVNAGGTVGQGTISAPQNNIATNTPGGTVVETNNNYQDQGQATKQEDIQLEKNNGEGVVYGRTTGGSNKVNTPKDPANPETSYIAGRQNNLNNLRSMDSREIAICMWEGYNPYGSQSLRDLQKEDPAKYAEVMEYYRQLQGEDAINSIAENGTTNTAGQIKRATDTINNDIDDWTRRNSSDRTYNSVLNTLTDKLRSNQVATSAVQEMLNINADIEDLQALIDDLPNEAKRTFKADTPQYILDAFIANRSAKYQSQMSKLQGRYNSAIDLYKSEVQQAQWASEMDLKEREYNFKVNQQNWDNNFQENQQRWTQYYQGQNLLLSSIKTDSKGRPYTINADGTYNYLTDATYDLIAQQQKQSAVDLLNASWADGTNGGQCEAFSDTFNGSVYGKQMIPRDENGNPIAGSLGDSRTTTAQEKAMYANTALPEIGSTAIFVYPQSANVSNDAKKRGHTMIVTGYDPIAQTITLKGSNGPDGDEKVYSKTMTLGDFYGKYHGFGFWDPTKPTRWETNEQVVQSGGVDERVLQMDDVFEELREGGKGLEDLASAQTMYHTLADIIKDGSLEALVTSEEWQKFITKAETKTFASGDRGEEFLDYLKKYAEKKLVKGEAQRALNQLIFLVEMKLRNESGAAISSSEWNSNFAEMVPGAYDPDVLNQTKLTNRDKVIRRQALNAGMRYDSYIPLFENISWMEIPEEGRQTF